MSTRFRDQYKKTGVLSCSEAGRFKRAQKKLQDRRTSRADVFGKQRDLTSIVADKGSVSEDRKLKLLKWKEEKRQKKLLEEMAARPVFKVGVVHHKLGSPFLTDLSNLKRSRIEEQTPSQSSKLKGRIIGITPVSVKESFAPVNFKFKAPVIKTSATSLTHNRIKTANRSTNVKSSAKFTMREQLPQPADTMKENQIPSQRVTRSQSRLNAGSKESNKIFKTKPIQKQVRAGKSSTTRHVPQLVSVEETVEEVEETVEMKGNFAGAEIPSDVQELPVESTQVNENPSTPIMKNDQYPVNYSPFVIKARGSTARRSLARRSIVNENDSEMDIQPPALSTDAGDVSKHGILYFRSVLESETKRLKSACDEWSSVQSSSPSLPQDASDLISAAIGQTQLLLSKKFVTFKGLVDRCEKSLLGENDGPLITCSDLDGFWDMMYREVENVDCRFNNLVKLKSNNWVEEIVPIQKPAGARKKLKKTEKTATSSLRALIAAARKKQKVENMSLENVRETLINTPVGTTNIKRTPSSVRHSRQSLLHQTILDQRRKSQGVSRESSPIITKVAQMGKFESNITSSRTIQTTPKNERTTQLDIQTPGKSILKTPVSWGHEEEIGNAVTEELDKTFTESKESELVRSSRRSTKKVRFEGQSDFRQRSGRLSFLDVNCDSPTILPTTREDLISFETPTAEPARVKRRSARLSNRIDKV